MARPLRIEFPGALYHITARGNEQQSIFLNESDRLTFLSILGKTIARHHWICHAYCLMGNHYHLLIETPYPNLSKGMRQLNGVYTQTFNRHHQRVGHLFQGRFKAILVEKDAHLKELCRYVALNPVRARLTKNPVQWEWSSFRGTIGAGARPDFLHTDWLLAQFGARRKQAVKGYVAFVREGMKSAATPWEDLRHGMVLGGERFIIKALGKAPGDHSLSEIPKAQKLPPARPLSDILLEAGNKKRAMADAFGTGRYTLREIAMFFGVHYSTVSRIVKGGTKG